mmetsp:Transcript_16555/g.31926  ORF Transcript_16555/g.31926 Transcript_16555/m.31926 type:complete len:532 (+) Transcript_16555:68-1663(+)|eukprot:CAMPEP_0114293884 /NCGR_PEP_ID=MMETSP0059-20121206/9828_1 /TAXON_ID=36894 /ORGANISM="Pyramimonas parkeae, Strain CCMP726" /LENGTH=531 /DNA_ID=CAMNT_0001415619 /DNA_START=51 /DNA_END=1646 /DNA_ORIENTATION=+
MGDSITFQKDETDPLYAARQVLLTAADMHHQHPIPPDARTCPRSADEFVRSLLPVLRVLNLNQEELYFFDPKLGAGECVSPRNEAAAHAQLLASVGKYAKGEPSPMVEAALGLCRELGSSRRRPDAQEERMDSSGAESQATGEAMLEWASSRGADGCLKARTFPGGLRGAVVDRPVEPNDVVLRVPKELLIHKELARASEWGQALLTAVAGVDDDTLAVLWTIHERNDPDSTYAPFWASLPPRFDTALGWSGPALAALGGTLMLDELLQAQRHVKDTFAALFPKLSDALPQLVPARVFTWEQYLWAVEVWYSNALTLMFPDGTIRDCLVPVVGLMNHKVHAHVYSYSRLDVATGNLHLRCLLPCDKGEQIFLAYGPASNQKLLTSYGFMLEDNPYDVLPISLAADDDDPFAPQKAALLQALDLGLDHFVGNMPQRHLPPRLLACLRVLLMDEQDFENTQCAPLDGPIGPQNEKRVHESLGALLEGVLQEMPEPSPSSDCSEELLREVLLAHRYVRSQRDMLSKILAHLQSA